MTTLQTPAKITRVEDELSEIAIDAYLYGYPLILMDVTRQVMTNVDVPTTQGGVIAAPMNQFAHAAEFPDASFTAVVRPNLDTLYSPMFFDVSKEPLLIDIPDSGDRYYLLPMLDMWTDVFACPGKRTTGTGAHRFALVGPEWHGELPEGVEVIRSPTPFGWVIGRTQTNGKADYEAVHAFQAGFRVRPLSATEGTTSPRGKTDPNISREPPPDQVAAMDPGTYFTRLAALMRENPPHYNDYPILERMERLGIVAGRALDLGRTSPEARAAMAKAPIIAKARMEAFMKHALTVVNGWTMMVNPIGTYGTDYLKRALIAFLGLGANVVEDAIYPTVEVDRDGNALDSSARYRIHFTKDGLPPARAFWSLTMYNDRQLLADNPRNRYAIGDRDDIQLNADGSLGLYLQRESPGKEKARNWLPTPASGNFTMNLRLYWPRPEALNGTWSPPAVDRLR
jgi:hypothetical protein